MKICSTQQGIARHVDKRFQKVHGICNVYMYRRKQSSNDPFLAPPIIYNIIQKHETMEEM